MSLCISNNIFSQFKISYIKRSFTYPKRERIILDGIDDEIVWRNFDWKGNHHLTKIEALDQNTADHGGHVYDYTKTQNTIDLYIRSSSPGLGIDFEILIYGEQQLPNHNFFGKISDASVVVYQ